LGVLGFFLALIWLPPVNLWLENASKEKVGNWLDKVLAENDNGPLMIGYHLKVGYSLENCLAIHDELVERGLVEKGRQVPGHEHHL